MPWATWNSTRPALRAALLLALLVVLWAPDAVLGQGVFWHHDLRTHHYPWRVWAAAEWLSGGLPAWCPGAANGYPLLADGQTGILYAPTMLLFMLLPDPLALDWSILLHAWWAAFGTWLLARALGRSEPAALLAAVGFGTGGFLVTHTLYLGMQNAAAWLPFALMTVVRATAPGGDRRWWAATAAALWLMLVAGHVQIAAYGWLLCGLLVLWRAWEARPDRRGMLQPLVAFALAAGAAAALAAPQLAASLELTRFSMRDGGVGGTFAGIGSLPPQELVNGILPRFFGMDRPADILQTYYHRGSGYWGQGENHWEMSFYLGVPIVVLASWRLLSRRDVFWKLVVLAALVLMLGRYTPVWGLVRHLPGMGWFRFPVRFALWLALAAPLLAAAGLDGITAAVAQARTGPVRRFTRRVAAAAAAAVIVLTVAHVALAVGQAPVRERLRVHFEQQVARPAPEAPPLPPLQRAVLADPEPEDPARIPAKVTHIFRSLYWNTSPLSPAVLWPAGLVGAVLLGLGTLRHRRLSPQALGMSAVALVAVDLWSFGGNYHPRVPRPLVEAVPTALQAMEGDPAGFRVTVLDRRQDPSLDTELASASLGLLWGLQDVIITSPLLLVRNELLLARAGLDLGADQGRAKVDRLLENLHLASLLGVRYLLTVHEIDDPRLTRLGGGAVQLYRNEEALPLATMVGCVRPLDGPEALLDRLDDLDPRREALVEAPPDAFPAALLACDEAAGTGTARVIARTSDRWAIRTEAAAPSLLVVSETAYPGWRATVDGEDVPLHTTNLALKGLVVPAGSHEVVLSYRPSWLRWSLGLSAASALCILGWLGVASSRRRRGTPGS